MPANVQFTIPAPCHENWQQMTPIAQGRFCNACQKTVIDFTALSDQEILRHMAKATQQVCGRFNTDQLGRPMAAPSSKRRFSWAYTWNLLMAALLVTGRAEAQAQAKGKIRVEQKLPAIPVVKCLIPAVINTVQGVIVDETTKQPIGFASLQVKGGTGGVAANEAGEFSLPGNDYTDSSRLVISAVGYISREVSYAQLRAGHTQAFYLTPAAYEMQGVTVISYNTRKISGTTGALISGIEVSRMEKIIREAKELLPKNDVKVYPNPVKPGNGLTVKLQLKQPGDYRLELMDAGGHLVQVQPLAMAGKEQVVVVPTQSVWAAGVYWLRIRHLSSGKLYQSKVVLQ